MSQLSESVRKLVKRIFPGEKVPLDKRLANMERVFQAPPLTPELVGAIRLISPQLEFDTSEKCRVTWEKDQNGACWGEYEALFPLLASLGRPERVLEIGPGLGRSVVFFSKKLGWESSDIQLYEGNGSTTKYALMGPRFEDSFCGNIPMLRYVLDYNGIQNATILDAAKSKLSELPGPYDLIYSFYSIGFHWSLEPFLDDLLKLMHNGSTAIFTVPQGFEPFPRLECFSYQIINWKAVWPKDISHKMLVLTNKRSA